jgi:hypothetical protein
MLEQAVISLVRYAVLMALYVEIMDFSDVAPCIIMDRYECFRGASLPYYWVSHPRAQFLILKLVCVWRHQLVIVKCFHYFCVHKCFYFLAWQVIELTSTLIFTGFLSYGGNIPCSRVDDKRIAEVGPDRACAEWLMRNGAFVKWTDDREFLKDYNALPAEGDIRYIQEIDATDSSVMHYGFEYFSEYSKFFL